MARKRKKPPFRLCNYVDDISDSARKTGKQARKHGKAWRDLGESILAPRGGRSRRRTLSGKRPRPTVGKRKSVMDARAIDRRLDEIGNWAKRKRRLSESQYQKAMGEIRDLQWKRMPKMGKRRRAGVA